MRVLLVDCNPYMEAATPISLGGLAALLNRRGHEARILSLAADRPFSANGLARTLAELEPALVGFAAYQRNLHHVRSLARLVHRVLPGSRVVLGGPQAAFLPDAALDVLPEVDFLARGEGEAALLALVQALETGAEERLPIAGVTRRVPGGGVVTGEVGAIPEDLDAYPSPWLEGVHDPAEFSEAILLGSRGCPHRCVFCLTPALSGGRVRRHSVERVLDEMALVAGRGSGRLWFADPNFCFSTARVVAILEGVLRRGLRVALWLEARADDFSDELARLMARAGVERVAFGLESASPAVLAGLDKGLAPDRVRQAVEAAFAAGLDVELFSQYALPGERLEDALSTLDFVTGCGVAIRGNSNAQQMQLYFGSDVSGRPTAHGIRPIRGSFPVHLAVGTEYETEWMSSDDISRVRDAWREASLDGGRRVVS